jgi:threonine dehydrogenase-like Zn-dependent dehydrogenase
LAKDLGASDVVFADKHQAENLRTFGEFDIVVDATGLPQVVQSMFSYVRPRGKIWIFGVVPPGQQASFSPYEVFRKDLTIIGSFAVNRTFQESIVLIQSGAIQVEALISHRLPLEQFSEGLHIAEHAPDRMKVQFEISSE